MSVDLCFSLTAMRMEGRCVCSLCLAENFRIFYVDLKPAHFSAIVISVRSHGERFESQLTL